MAKAYLVAVYYKIHDEEKLKNYGADALPAMMANGGNALARGTNKHPKSKECLLKGQ